MNTKKISGYVFCKKTNRVLHNPIVYWFGEDGNIHEKIFGTKSEGRFDIELPEGVKKLYVGNRGYSVREILLKPTMDNIIVHLNKN
ncbi:MAG: hypothetical protein NW226_00075 [Microscillaceae bacterium]|nr:hypothetical protein [Microscillaceae bacterium]